MFFFPRRLSIDPEPRCQLQCSIHSAVNLPPYWTVVLNGQVKNSAIPRLSIFFLIFFNNYDVWFFLSLVQILEFLFFQIFVLMFVLLENS